MYQTYETQMVSLHESPFFHQIVPALRQTIAPDCLLAKKQRLHLIKKKYIILSSKLVWEKVVRESFLTM
jgi:hypothetical protein